MPLPGPQRHAIVTSMCCSDEYLSVNLHPGISVVKMLYTNTSAIGSFSRRRPSGPSAHVNSAGQRGLPHPLAGATFTMPSSLIVPHVTQSRRGTTPLPPSNSLIPGPQRLQTRPLH